MKKFLFPLLLAVALSAHAQVPVSPAATFSHVTFVNGVGAPCAGCKLSSFHAGTTTPLATFVDSTGTSTNTNPITLDAAGGANIWLGNNSYKFVLEDALGATIWTVDQVNAGNLFPCGPAHTIQASNSAVNGLECDSQITINTTNHTISVGTLPANHVTIGALGTPTSWNLDTTTPQTALASMGGASGSGTINQIAIFPATGSAIAGSDSIPSAITATTQSPSDNSGKVASTAYVATPGIINPTSVQIASGTAMTDNQGNGIKVQHSTGTTTTDDLVKFDANGNVVDAGTASIPITGQLVVGSPLVLASNTCSTNSVTMSDSVPANRVVVISPNQGASITGLNQPPSIIGVSGAIVTVAFCNAWVGTVTVSSATYNLGVL